MDTNTIGRTYTTEELFGSDKTGATYSTEELFPSAIPKQTFSTEELFGTVTPKIEERPSMRAMTPQEQATFEKESFNVQKQREVKERYGIFENPKVNYYAEKIAPRLPGWLIGGAGYPVIAGIFEALQQAKNIAMSLKEKSKYDPLASRQLSEMIPEDSPGWLKALGETGEYASDMVIAGVAGKAIHEGLFKRNLEKFFEKADAAGWTGVREKYKPIIEKYGKAATIEEEIKRGIKIGKEEIPTPKERGVGMPAETVSPIPTEKPIIAKPVSPSEPGVVQAGNTRLIVTPIEGGKTQIDIIQPTAEAVAPKPATWGDVAKMRPGPPPTPKITTLEPTESPTPTPPTVEPFANAPKGTSALARYLAEKKAEGYSEQDLKRSEGIIRDKAQWAGMDPDRFVVERMTPIEKGTEPIAPSGDYVIHKPTGNKLKILDNTQANTILVENPQGSQMRLMRNAVEFPKAEPTVPQGKIAEIELRHYTKEGMGFPTTGDANGLTWFTEGQSYLKGNYVKTNIPESKLLRLDETQGMLEKYLASPFGKKGRSKLGEMKFAESEGYWAVKRGNDISMTIDQAKKIAPKQPWEMTRDEYLDYYSTPDFIGNKAVLRNKPQEGHAALVRKALSEGKPVPPEVLADYPYLVKPVTPLPVPNVEILPEYTKEMADTKAEAERLKKEAERQRELKAVPRERIPKEIKPVYDFTGIEKDKLAKDITYLTSGSKTPRDWRLHPEQIDANRNELILQAYEKLPKMPNPAELKEFINKKAPYINHEALQTRKEQAESRVGQFPEIKTEEGRIEVEPSEEASVFGKQEPIKEGGVSEGEIADDILREGAAGDERIHEILKARHLQEPESFEALGKRLGMTRGNVHHLYKKGMANLKDPDKMAERVARLKGNEGEAKADELAKKMEADIGPTKVKAGLSVQMTHPPSPSIKGKPGFAFPEKIEERYQKAKKVPKPTTGEKVGGFLEEVRHGITRTYPKLPNTGESIEVKQALKRLEKARSIIADKLVRTIRSITYKLNADQYDLANRKIIVNDLLKEASVGHDLPFGFDEATLKDVAPKLNDAIGDNPAILDVIKDRKELWDATRNDYIYWRDKVGHDVTAVLNNSDYFRHSILELMNKKRMVSGMGKKFRKHTGQSFLKKRAGSEMDILSDFLQADHEVLSQMLYDIEEAKTIDSIKKTQDISKKLRKEAKEKGVPIEDVIPEGYTKWQPKEGHSFYVADTLPAKVAEQILSGEIEDLGVVADSLRKSLAMGRERETWIIRKEVADTLDELRGPQKLTLAQETFKDINLAWKWSALSLPRRTIKYGLRNLSGDAEHIAVGNPKTFLRFPRAFREMFEVYFGDRPLTGDALIFADKGGLQTTLQVQEIADIPKLPMFRNLYKASKLDDINIFKKYWRAINKVQNFRESIGRYAAFLEYKRQMQKNPNGMPDNYGASIPEEIQGLADIDDRAFRLSNELLGGYDEVSATGQILRKGIYPFWSWPEINTKFYFRMMKNAVYNDGVALKMGKKMLGGAEAGAKIGIGTTLKIGRFAIRAMGLSILLAAYNNIFFPDEEKELPENVRYRAHINFGHDKDGKPVYFSRLGSLSDFLQLFGMDAPQAHVADFLNGRKTIKEIAIDMAKSPINVLVSGISPFLKAPFESAMRQSLFPDVFKPSKIRDRGLYLARQIGLEDEFRTIMGKPGKPYMSTLDQLALYKSDPLEISYYEIRDIKNDWLKKEGKESISFYLNPSSEALYNMKLALRYNEHKLVNKYAEQYAQIVRLRHKGESENAIRKYVADGMKQSLENLHPLSGLRLSLSDEEKASGIKTSERKSFLLSLRPEERDILLKALRFYNEILIGGSDFKDKD